MLFSDLSHRIIGLAIEVHRQLGPGLLESVYERCLCYELQKNGLSFRSQLTLPVLYGGEMFDNGYRIDICVEDKLIIELKAVEAISRLHEAQIMTYLRLSGIQEGLLINFNVLKLVDGIKWYRLAQPSCPSSPSGEVQDCNQKDEKIEKSSCPSSSSGEVQDCNQKDEKIEKSSCPSSSSGEVQDCNQKDEKIEKSSCPSSSSGEVLS